MTTLIRNPRLREGLGNFILVFLSVGIVILYSSYQRPIWFDELMHYACGGWTNWAEVYQRIFAPIYNGTADFSYPSSVFYSAATYPVLQIFGANAFSFRYLSLIGGIAVLALGLLFLRKVGASWAWQIVFLFAMTGQFFAMSYVAEARPYALLGGTCLAAALYYLYRSRGSLPKFVIAVGWLGCVVGSLNHVYFMLYLVVFILFFYFAKVLRRFQKPSWRGLWKFSNPSLLGTAVVIQLVLRLPHALQRPALQRNWLEPSSSAFQYTSPEGGFLRVWADTSFQFLPLPSVVAPLVVVGLVALGAISLFYDFRGRQMFRGLVEPVSHTLLLLGISAFISAASLFGGYQILNRQWIASLLLMPVAFVWLAVAVGQNVKVLHPNAYKVLFLVIAVPVVLMGIYRGESRAQALVSAEANLQQIAATYPQINARNAASFILGEPGAVVVANINLAVGGEVWSDFRVEGRPYVHACTTG